MTSTTSTEGNSQPVWEFVSITGYDVPSAPVGQTVKQRLALLRHIFGRVDAPPEDPLKKTDDLRVLPPQQLDRIAPLPNWQDAAVALDLKLTDWLEQQKPDPRIILLVGPPYGGHAGILASWAEQKAWPVLDPPSPEQILAGDDAWLSELANTGGSWVFPNLERAYLRHAAGLGPVRAFLDRASAGDLGRGIIGCDSWAWAFLQRAWRGRLPIVLALQAFDQARLTHHFQQLAVAADGRDLIFCQSDTGHYVLPPPDVDQETYESSNFLQLLAAHSRGIPGIAWAGWRASLCKEQEGTQAEKALVENQVDLRRTIWVTPWDQLKKPAVPGVSRHDEAVVLHTLLLHNGLTLELMRQILPLLPTRVTETVAHLQEAGLVAQDGAAWRVTPLGYPPARQFLQDVGYLVDQF